MSISARGPNQDYSRLVKTYRSDRAAQERTAAKLAADPRARRCHEQLAKLHSMPAPPSRGGNSEDLPESGSRVIILG